MSKIKTGIFTVSSTGDMDITDVGFEVGFVMFFWRPSNLETSGSYATGADDGSNRFSVAASENGTDYARRSNTTSSLRVIDSSGGVHIDGNVSSFLSNGFRINVSTQLSNQAFSYLAFEKGADVKVGHFAVTSTGTLDVTDVGFKPARGMFFWRPSDNTGISALGMGVYSRNILTGEPNGGYATTYNDNGTDAARRRYLGDASLAAIGSTNNEVIKGDVTEELTNGFRFNIETQTSSQNFSYIAFGKNVHTHVINVTLPDSGSSYTVNEEDNLTFTPQGFFSFLIHNSSASFGANHGLGTADDTLSQSSMSWAGSRRSSRTNRFATRKLSNGSDNSYEASVSNIGEKEYTLSLDINDVSSRFVIMSFAGISLNVNDISSDTSLGSSSVIPRAKPVEVEGYFYGGWGAGGLGSSYYGSASTMSEITLSVAQIVSDTVMGDASLLQAHNLSVSSIASDTSVEPTPIDQVHILQLVDLISDTSLESVSINQASVLTVNSIVSQTSMDGAGLSQKHILAIESLLSETFLGSGNVTTSQLIRAKGIASEVFLGTPGLSQKHELEIKGLITKTILAGILIKEFTILKGDPEGRGSYPRAAVIVGEIATGEASGKGSYRRASTELGSIEESEDESKGSLTKG